MMDTNYYLGLDPGVSGGLVIVDGDGCVAMIGKMPDTEQGIYEWLRWTEGRNVKAALEWIHPAIQGIGKASMAKLYGNYKFLWAMLIAYHVPFDIIKPQVWQRGIGVSKRGKTETQTRWKNRLKSRAKGLHPEEKVTLATADALLIATYLQRLRCGQIQAVATIQAMDKTA